MKNRFIHQVVELNREGKAMDIPKTSLLEDALEMIAGLKDSLIQLNLLKQVIGKYIVLERLVSSLLRNTLPKVVADEIQDEGFYRPRPFQCTILFADVAGFTRIAESMPGEKLIQILNSIFSIFDALLAQHGGTKVKTIGDAYMAVFGAPEPLADHPRQAVRTGLSLIHSLADFNRQAQTDFQVRVGIHTGEVMAGVVGRDRMQFDIFGDTVNVASRFESSGEKGRVNISAATHAAVRDCFAFEPRGKIPLKNKADAEGYFVLHELTPGGPAHD